MRKRTVKKQLWLNEDEAKQLKEKAKKTNFSEAGLLRQYIHNHLPKQAPPADYYTFIKELRQIGSSINEMLQIAKQNSVFDVDALSQELKNIRSFEKAIYAVFIPEKESN